MGLGLAAGGAEMDSEAGAFWRPWLLEWAVTQVGGTVS